MARNPKAVRRRMKRIRFEQKKQRRLKARARKRVVVIELYGYGRNYRIRGKSRVAKAGGPKRVTVRAHR